MRLFYFFFTIIFLVGCSFDNKSGIWENDSSQTYKKQSELFGDFKKFSSTQSKFNKTVTLDKNFSFNKIAPIKNKAWKDIFYNNSNNRKNFKYNDQNQLVLKSKKITNHITNKYLLVEDNNIIVSDVKGNINIFSLEDNILLERFNFYKKKYKKIKKKLNMIVQDNTIYVSDNLGYIYAYNYSKKKILWAKDLKIPFRSNLKITKDIVFASNQNNEIIFIDIKNGEIIKSIPTEENVIKNQFTNSLSLNQNSLFFLNSFGSLYSIDTESLEINWFINLNKSVDLSPSNLFYANQIIHENNKVIVSTKDNTYLIDANNGIILEKKNFSSIIQPIIYGEYIFFVTDNDLLISMSLNDGKILYSYNINQLVADYLNTKKKKVLPKNLLFLNNEIFIFLANSYLINFNMNGSLKDLRKLPAKINSEVIVIAERVLFLGKDNKIRLIN